MFYQELNDQQIKAYRIISERLKTIEKAIVALESDPPSKQRDKSLAIWRKLQEDNIAAMRLFCGDSYLIH